MRQLFVPACLCVMTFSNTTGFDLPIDKFAGSPTFDKKVLIRESSSDGEAPENQIVKDPELGDETISAVAEVPSDLTGPADAPPALRPALEPEKIPLPPVAKPVVNRSRQEVCDSLAQAAQNNNLPVPFFIRLLFQESGFQPGIVSSAGAEGIAQFMPETSASEGLNNPFDPLQAIPASARFLRKLLAQFGNLGLAAAAYNAGPKRVQDWLASKGKGRLPDETRGYVKTVTGRPAETWRVASASGTELTVPRHAPCQEIVPPVPPRAHPSAHPSAHVVAAAKTSAHPRVVTAAKTTHGKPALKVAANAAKTPATKAPAPHKPPIQQLAARKHKARRRNQTIAQR